LMCVTGICQLRTSKIENPSNFLEILILKVERDEVKQVVGLYL
jgi:hypothetical protein